MRETWYVLEDGSAVDPNECAPDESGALVHSGGVPVAMRGDTPHSRGVDVDDAKPFGAKPPATAPAAKPKDMRAQQPKHGYKTRQTKTR